MSLLENGLVPTITPQIALASWGASPLASDGTPPLSLLYSKDREVPSFGFVGSFPPALHAQPHPDGIPYFQRTGFSYYDPFPHATHQQLPPFPQTINPRLLVHNYGTTPTIPGFTVDQPPATLTRGSPSPVQDLPAYGSAECTGDLWQFVRMRHDSQYECLWDDGSGRLCGQIGTLLGVKRHLRSNHNFKRSSFCTRCKKSFCNATSLRYHSNQHTGENPYSCQDCEMVFKNPNALRGHRIRRHGYVPKERGREVNWRKRQSNRRP